MTEEDWLACAEPRPMLEFLVPNASGRKLRLFAVACCRRIQHAFDDQAGIDFRLGVAERYADGLATSQELRMAQPPLYLSSTAHFLYFGEDATGDDPRAAAWFAHARCEGAALCGLTKPRPRRSGWLTRLGQ